MTAGGVPTVDREGAHPLVLVATHGSSQRAGGEGQHYNPLIPLSPPMHYGNLVLMSSLSHNCITLWLGTLPTLATQQLYLRALGCLVLAHSGCQTPCPMAAEATVTLAL